MAIITDGEENSSRSFRLAEVRRLVEARREAGWTFVFLGAGLEAYAESGSIGIDPRSVQRFRPGAEGARAAFAALSSSLLEMRADVHAAAPIDRGDFFRGTKAAEEV